MALDIVATEDLDGAEVHSDVIHLDADKAIPFDVRPDPAASKPMQTI